MMEMLATVSHPRFYPTILFPLHQTPIQVNCLHPSHRFHAPQTSHITANETTLILPSKNEESLHNLLACYCFSFKVPVHELLRSVHEPSSIPATTHQRTQIFGHNVTTAHYILAVTTQAAHSAILFKC
mmetsp:Transcript_14188/g.34582  ORF Transcript_14188/g.34582 Transcript_14188/m.34582 type:complete len:128 (-) Transcript_14188:118-501(-)